MRVAVEFIDASVFHFAYGEKLIYLLERRQDAFAYFAAYQIRPDTVNPLNVDEQDTRSHSENVEE